MISLSPKLVAATLVGIADSVLLVKRSYGLEKGLWAPPGGYVEQGEVVEEAARREVHEETGIEVVIKDLVGLYSQEGHAIVLAVFNGEWVDGHLHDLSPEVENVGFFAVNNLPPLAFPRDLRIIDTWVRRNQRAKT